MIVRRIRESLLAGNLSQIALEPFIVIVGVFIGIQVSSGNDEWIEGNRAHSYLKRFRI